VQRLPGRALDPTRQRDPQPQEAAGDVGEPLGLHGPLELAADRPLDGVEGPPPKGLWRHVRCLPV
jgi:hypothetical protein